VIVVDSSAWIARLRGQATPATLRLRAFVEDGNDQVRIGDPIAAHPGLLVVPA
jgi:hypothetical protein